MEGLWCDAVQLHLMPVSWLAIPVGVHSNGVFFPIVIAGAAIAGASIVLFRRGRWKRQQIQWSRTVRSG